MTYAEARDAVLDLFKDAWTPTTLPVRYWDAPEDAPIDTSGNWAAVRVAFTSGAQASFGGPTRRYERQGIVTVQIFTLFGTGLADADSLAKIVVDAFEGQDSGRVWFRNVGAVSVGHQGQWFQTNVTAEFTFDEVK